MPELSISEIVRHYRISDKSVRNWIDAGWLPAKKQLVAGHIQYFIDVQDIERVLRDRGSYRKLLESANTNNDSSRLDDLEQRVTELEHLVHDLQAARAPQPGTIDYAVTPPHKATPRPSQREKRSKDKYLAEKIQTYKNKSHP